MNGSVGNAASINVSKLIGAICFVLIFSVMNVTMFNVALPNIAAHFDLLPSEVSWVMTGYSVIYALGSLIYGKLADRFPLRTLITFGIVLFSLGSCVGFFAQNYAVLIVGRCVQAMGASAIPALSMLVPTRYIPQETRGRAIGTVTSTIAFAAGIGPIAGGFLAGSFSWNYLFIVSMGPLIALPYFLKILPKEDVRPGTFDGVGALLLGGAVVTLLFSITYLLWLLSILSLFLFIIFSFWTQKRKDAFIQPKLFRIKGFVSSLTVMFINGVVGFAALISMPLLLGNVNGLAASTIGMAMFPGAMAGAFLGRAGGRLADLRGNAFLAKIGLSLIFFGVLFLYVTAGNAAWMIAAFFIFINVGYSFMQVSISNHVSRLLPRESTGVGMGTLMLTGFLSGAISGAMTTKVLDYSTEMIALNPLISGIAVGYSNVFLGLAFLAAINIMIVVKKMHAPNEL